MPNLYVDLPLSLTPEALPHCEAALDWYLVEGGIGRAEMSHHVIAELENLRNTFRAMDQQIRAGYRKAVDLSIDPLLR